jgi:hypothetical protein
MYGGIPGSNWVNEDPDLEDGHSMSGTITRIGMATAGALLTVGLLTASPAGAKPSERDDKDTRPRTAACFDETGKTQGKSHSDPDGMSNGGFDKPGCTGGFDSDRDGNNGCGNDADREDDNNGHCGRPDRDRLDRDRADDGGTGSSTPTTSTTTTTAPDGTDDGDIAAAGTPTVGTAAETTTVLAGTAATTDPSTTDPGATDPGATDPGAADAVTTEVLGETLEQPGTLPRTGAGIAGLAVLGGVLCGGGRLAALARRLTRIG